MTTCVGKSYSFGLLCVSFVGVVKFSFSFGIRGSILNVIVLSHSNGDSCLIFDLLIREKVQGVIYILF